jgi:subtilisin family serine protease
VIAVGAVGRDGQPTAFSTRGDHVALCAPGVRIPTVAIEGHGVQTGTSFAAPFVTAACALLHARAARLSRALTPALARAVLVDAARPFPLGTRSTGCGAGILELPAALARLERALRPIDPAFPSMPAPAALGA